MSQHKTLQPHHPNKQKVLANTKIKHKARWRDTNHQSQLYIQVYYATALLQHISADINKSSGELKAPKKNYHICLGVFNSPDRGLLM